MRVSTAFAVRLWVVKHLINWVHSIIHHQSPHYKHLQVKSNDWRIMILLQCDNLLGIFGSQPFTVKGCYWLVVYSPPKNPVSWPDLQIGRVPIQSSIYGMYPTQNPLIDSVPLAQCLVGQDTLRGPLSISWQVRAVTVKWEETVCLIGLSLWCIHPKQNVRAQHAELTLNWLQSANRLSS